MALRIKNVAAGFTDATGFHPLRSSSDYDEDRAGDEYGSRSDRTGLRYARGHKPKARVKAKAKKRTTKRGVVRRAVKRVAPKRKAVKRKNPSTSWRFMAGGIAADTASGIGSNAAIGIAHRLAKVYRSGVSVYRGGKLYAVVSNKGGRWVERRVPQKSAKNPSLKSLIPGTRWVTAKVKMVGKELKMILPGKRRR